MSLIVAIRRMERRQCRQIVVQNVGSKKKIEIFQCLYIMDRLPADYKS